MSDAHVVFVIQAYDAAGTIRENYANILVLLLRLRQACDHPLLLNGQESDLIDGNSIERAKQLPKETVTNLLEKLERGPAICSICNVSNWVTQNLLQAQCIICITSCSCNTLLYEEAKEPG